MNVNYINPFINACIEVFSTFANLDSRPGKPRARIQPSARGELKAIIGLNGHGIDGYFIIHLTRAHLENIMATLFDSTARNSDEDLKDLAGELTNMITGCAKAQLSRKGFFFDVALPRISTGDIDIPTALEKEPVIQVPFETDMGIYVIEASIKTIDSDLAQDTCDRVPAPPGMLSLEDFATKARIHPIKLKRLLKTGHLIGERISNQQWHIPNAELKKFPGRHQGNTPVEEMPTLQEATLSLKEFSQATLLPQAKIKRFIRSGFILAALDENKNWLIPPSEILKFKKIS